MIITLHKLCSSLRQSSFARRTGDYIDGDRLEIVSQLSTSSVMFAFSIVTEIKSVVIRKRFMLFLLFFSFFFFFFAGRGFALYWPLRLINSSPTDFQMYFKIITLQQRISVKILNHFIILLKKFETIFCPLRSFFSFDHPFKTATNSFCLSSC